MRKSAAFRSADGRTLPFRLTDEKGTIAGRGDLK